MINKSVLESTNLNLIDGIYSALWEAPNSKPSNDVIVFVHGGPGSNSSYFEKALQEIPSFLNGRFGWLTFDQRGCGRSNSFSDSSITHEKNMEDLKGLLDALEVRNYNSITVYGHSYGARLGFDTFRAFPEIKSKLVMGGRAVFRKDSVSYMLLMHYLIIKHYYPHLAEAAHEIVAGSDPSSMNKSLKELKRLFPSAPTALICTRQHCIAAISPKFAGISRNRRPSSLLRPLALPPWCIRPLGMDPYGLPPLGDDFP